MRFQTSDPDIATVFRRIDLETIDLQPDFQRGEVWSIGKKQRLIDSILRKWHVPPIHLVAKAEGKFDVLDGQQRLTAIRDFLGNKFPVHDTIEPPDSSLDELAGLKWHELPTGTRREFENFTIRIFELHDYTPPEPYELFFRLNQPTNLTEAEKRNAFIGGPRNQVKELVEWAVSLGMNQKRVGFSNARMAYDEVIARFLLTLEQKSLLEKVTAIRITNRYRSSSNFSNEIIRAAKEAIALFLGLPMLDREERIRPNKATIHTWLCMAAELHDEGHLDSLGSTLADTIELIESNRVTHVVANNEYATPLQLFNDRATARVADVMSVVLRDLTAWMVFEMSTRGTPQAIPMSLSQARQAWTSIEDSNESIERSLADFVSRSGWGGHPWL